MDAIFMNSENSKTSDPHRLLLNPSDKTNLKRIDKYVALSNISIYYAQKNIKKSCKNYKFKIPAPTWNKEFELSGRSFSVSIIQDYIQYILKQHEAVTDNLSIRIYVNKTENRITYKIKTGYYFELLTPETMKLVGSTKSNCGNVTRLEITEVVLIHSNILSNGYQQYSRVLYTFVPNKSFGQLLDISPMNFIFLKTFDSEF